MACIGENRRDGEPRPHNWSDAARTADQGDRANDRRLGQGPAEGNHTERRIHLGRGPYRREVVQSQGWQPPDRSGDFDTKQPFSFGAGLKPPVVVQTGAIFGGWTPRTNIEAGTFGVPGWQDRAHIVHKWPENGLKVLTKNPLNPPNEWNHIFITYDGFGKRPA